MLRARILLDEQGFREIPEGAVPVRGLADYPRACHAIRAALRGPLQPGAAPLLVIVCSKVASRWLSQWVAQWDKAVSISTHTAKAELEHRWGVPVPEEVTNEEVLAARLLDEKVAIVPDASFDDVLLRHFYGPPYASRSVGSDRLVTLANHFHADQWQSNAERPLVVAALKRRLTYWESKARTSEQLKWALRRLHDDPAGLRRDLALFQVMQGYLNDIGTTVLTTDATENLTKLKLDLSGLQVQGSEYFVAQHGLRIYLAESRNQPQSVTDVEKLLKKMSGLLKLELDKVEEWLSARPEWLSREIVDAVERKFEPLEEETRGVSARLRSLIMPPFPLEPATSWTPVQWLQWVQGSYMPYYAWMEINNRPDRRVACYAEQFADWFYEAYPTLQYGGAKFFSFAALQTEEAALRDTDAVSLVVLLDNFNFVHAATLRSFLEEQGLVCEREKPLFSCVPTATEVGKRPLLSGKINQEGLPSDFPAFVKQVWEPKLHGKAVAYLPNIGALNALRERPGDVVFLNYLALDSALHEDANQTGRSHAEVIRELLRELARSIARYGKKFNVREQLKVYILSDHGCTRIPGEVVNGLDKSFYGGLADEKHHRYVSVSDDKLKNLPQMVGQQCYPIPRERFQTGKNFLAARGYYRFAPTTDSFYVHGGLTPEEVVVPFACYSFIALKPEPLVIRLLQSVFRLNLKSRVEVEVGNPNDFALSDLEFRLLDVGRDEVTIKELAPLTKQTLGFDVSFRRMTGAAAKERTLLLRTRFRAGRQLFEPDDVPLTVTIKAIQEVKDDLDL